MNRNWGDGRPMYECAQCGREVLATRDGYLPRHYKPGKRAWCDGSESHTRDHRKVAG